MDLPFTCTLSTTELQERKTTILASLRNAVWRRTRIPENRYEFESHSTTLRDVTRMIGLERQCCRFLHLAVTEGENIVQLEVTSQREALAIIEDLFG